MRFVRWSASLLVTCAALVTVGLKAGDDPAAEMKTYAESFLKSLDDQQKEQATMPYGSNERVEWHFIPMETRKGLVLSDMDAAQRTAALRLVRAALSEVGYDKTSKIMLLESVLREMEGEGRRFARDPQKYYVTIFGKPSASEPWGLSFEGHHLSLNFVCRDGELVDNTPLFFGANPATIMNEVEGPLGDESREVEVEGELRNEEVVGALSKGTRVLRDEEQLAFELVNSLKEGQADTAIIAEEAPADIRFAGEAQVDVGQPEGIAFGDLTSDQQEQLKRLVQVYINSVPEEVAKRRRAAIDRGGWDGVHFAWAGATEPGIGHYYRIRGEEFLIEFVNTQPDPAGNPANHIHCVWRDLTGDFGLDN